MTIGTKSCFHFSEIHVNQSLPLASIAIHYATRSGVCGVQSEPNTLSGDGIMSQLSLIRSSLTANTAGLPFAHRASDMPGYALASEQRRQ